MAKSSMVTQGTSRPDDASTYAREAPVGVNCPNLMVLRRSPSQRANSKRVEDDHGNHEGRCDTIASPSISSVYGIALGRSYEFEFTEPEPPATDLADGLLDEKKDSHVP